MQVWSVVGGAGKVRGKATVVVEGKDEMGRQWTEVVVVGDVVVPKRKGKSKQEQKEDDLGEDRTLDLEINSLTP